HAFAPWQCYVGDRHGVDDAAGDAHQLLGAAALHAPRRHLLILALQRLDDLYRADVVGAHLIRVELHFDLPPIPAHDVDATNALNGLEAGRYNLLGEIGD